MMTLISTVTVTGSPAANINFASIASTFTDLLLICSLRGTGILNDGGQAMYAYFNGSTANLTGRELNGTGSSVASSSNYYVVATGGDSTANTFGSVQFYIPNYAGSTFKSISADGVGENNATKSDQEITAGLWSSTAAINQVTVAPKFVGSLAVGSTISLYGITKGSGGATVSP